MMLPNNAFNDGRAVRAAARRLTQQLEDTMLARYSSKAALIIVMASLSACAASTIELSATLRDLNLSAPEVDLDANLKRRDYRFIGIYGITCLAPGVAKEELVLVSRYGMRCLNGTSDAIEGPMHMRLIRQASQYAAAYNDALIHQIRSGHVL